MRVVLLHGFTQTGRSWEPIAAVLRAAGHDVCCPDVAGHGEAPSAVPADLWAAADELAEAGGPGVWVGYSMGGRLALHVALRYPQPVRALVLIGTTAGIDDAAERAQRVAADEALAQGLERDGLEPFLERWLAQPLFAGLPPDTAGLDERRRNDPAALAAVLRQLGTGRQEPLWRRLGELAMPVLVLAGEHDEKFTAIGRRFAAAIDGATGPVLVPGAGHAAHLECPAFVADTIAEWLKQR